MTGKLAVTLSAALLAILAAALWMFSRATESRFEREIDSRLETSWRRLAAQCGEAWGPNFRTICLDSLYHTIGASESSALDAAYVLDDRLRVLLDGNFLRNDFGRRGTVVDDPAIRLEADQTSPFSTISDGRRIIGAPVYSANRRVATVVAIYREDDLSRSLDPLRNENRRELALALLLASIPVVLLSAGVAYYFLSPLDAVAQAAWKIGDGDLKSQLPEGRADEIGQLYSGFNRMIGRLAELDELKSSFMAKITHDLKSPLASMELVLGNLLSGGKGPLAAGQAEDIELVRRHGKSLAELVDHILEVTRLEAGGLDFQKDVVDVQSEMDTVLALLHPRAQEFQVALSASLSPELKQVFADDAAFRRVLINLVSNALKFTPKGGRISIEARRSGPNEALFCVADTGIGIPKERIASLFKKFSQVPETRNKVREAGGTGLGLLICKEIVEAHGGRIWAESELFRGTKICFTLPESGSRRA